MAKQATIKDVAEMAGVSVGTVSKVLNGEPTVKVRLRDKVNSACQDLGFRPNQVAASLRRQSSRTIGVLLPDIMNTFYAELVGKIENLATESNYSVIIQICGEDPQKMKARVGSLMGRKVDGAIVIPTLYGSEFLEPTIGDQFPVVIVDRISANDPYPSIAIENFGAAREGTEYLLSIGHEQIAMVSNSPELFNSKERIGGYTAAIQKAGLEPNLKLVGMTVEDAALGVKELIESDHPPSAILTANNVATTGAIKSLQAGGLHMPKDISLLAFDDFDWLALMEPPISAIRQPAGRIAEAAWRQLLGSIAGQPVASPKIRFDTVLNIRGSTMPVLRSNIGGVAHE